MLTSTLALWVYGYKARPFMRWTGTGLVAMALLSLWPARWADAAVLGGAGVILSLTSFVWPRCQPSSRALRYLGLAAFFAVVLQGVLGGLRVVLYKDQIGILHAALAQCFFVLLCILALLTRKSKEVQASAGGLTQTEVLFWRRASWLFAGVTALIFCQLVLGATMRHQHAGLAISDFPLAYGKLWPAMDPSSIEVYNARRMEVVAVKPITAFQIVLQMVHRLMALGVLAGVGVCAWWLRRNAGKRIHLSRLALGWLGLVFVQAILGAATIWSGKAADVATAHVMVGAASLALGAIGTLLCLRVCNAAASLSRAPKQTFALSSNPSAVPAAAAQAALH
jgi:cytochrome c oxidase assembly protein subunit 15